MPTIYYISTNGNDLLAGMSPATAWQTIDKVNATVKVPGDRFRFNGGQTHRGTLDVQQSGTNGSPIVFDSYGLGSAILTRAEVLGSDWTSIGSNRWTHAVTPTPTQVFFNLVRGTLEASQAAVTAPLEWFWAADVLTVYSTSDPATAYIAPGVETDGGGTVGAASAFGQAWLTFTNLIATRSAYGFWTFGSGSFVTFTNCEASYCYYDGIGNGYADAVAVNCTSHDHRHTGLTTNAARTRVFGGSYYNNAPDEDAMYDGGGGVGFGVGATDGLVQGATCYNNIYGLKAFGDGCDRITFRANRCYMNTLFGIDIDSGPSDCVVEDNLVYDNLLHQIAVELADTSGTIARRNRVSGSTTDGAGIEILAAVNSEVYDNIIYACGSGIALYSSPQNTVVYGNTIDGSTVADINCVSDDASISGVTIKNNICSGSGVYAFHADTNTIANFSSDFNDWNGLMRYNSVTVRLDQWQQLVGQDQHSISTDPRFVNATVHDYTLAFNSPCLFAGTTLRVAYAVAVRPGSVWPDAVQTINQNALGMPWNMGAYGSTAGAPTVAGPKPSDTPKAPSLAMLRRDYTEPERVKYLDDKCPTCGLVMELDKDGLFCLDCDE